MVWTGADAEIVGEIDPANGARRVDQELGRASDVMAVHAGAFVKEIVTADHFGIAVGEKSVRVTSLAAEILRLRGRVDADRDRLYSQFFEIL